MPDNETAWQPSMLMHPLHTLPPNLSWSSTPDSKPVTNGRPHSAVGEPNDADWQTQTLVILSRSWAIVDLDMAPHPQVLRAPAAGRPALWQRIALGLSLPVHTGTESHFQGCGRLLETKTRKPCGNHAASHSAAIFSIPTACESPNHVGKFSLEQCPAQAGAWLLGSWGHRSGPYQASGCAREACSTASSAHKQSICLSSDACPPQHMPGADRGHAR